VNRLDVAGGPAPILRKLRRAVLGRRFLSSHRTRDNAR